MNGKFSLILSIFIFSSCSSRQDEPQFPDAYDPEYAASFDEPTDSRVSTSAGEEGGLVLLWPRVIPSEGAEAVSTYTASLQSRMRALVERMFPEIALDVRPEPQRACPSSGCLGHSFGAILIHRGGGCAIVATMSGPGESIMHLTPWTENARLRASVVPFREPPESQVAVGDLVPCGDLEEALAAGDGAVEVDLQNILAALAPSDVETDLDGEEEEAVEESSDEEE